MRNLILIVWPSGSWKTTILNKILEKRNDYEQLISFTTRIPRIWEIHWKDYNFISRKEFKILEKRGEIIESADFNENIYGKRYKDIQKIFEEWKNILTIVETQWVKSFLNKKKEIEDLWYNIKILFLDIDKDIIKERMLKRGDNIDDINKRLDNNDYDYFSEIKDIANYILYTHKYTIDENINYINKNIL